jgi:hypothetical protein
MALSYEKLKKRSSDFKNLTGLTVEEFTIVVEKTRPEYKKWEETKKGPGRHSKFRTLEDKILGLLIYYRTYITHTFLGYLFDCHNSNVCRLFKIIEPLVARKVSIKKDRTLTADKVMAILADVTEIPTQRPQTKQKKVYSGKKKRHTLKAEIAMTENGRIIAVSRVYGGRTHDFTIRKKEKPFCRDSVKLVDSGYQGLQKRAQNVGLPVKRSRKQPLTKEQKDQNKALSKRRVRIENKIRELKIFRVLKDGYRNFQRKLHLRLNIVAGIVNLKNGF